MKLVLAKKGSVSRAPFLTGRAPGGDVAGLLALSTAADKHFRLYVAFGLKKNVDAVLEVIPFVMKTGIQKSLAGF
jgi:hypothetical protein